MAMLPVRRDPTPLATRPATARTRASATPEPPTGESPAPDPLLGEALAKVSTPADQELAQQQAAFNRMIELQAENQREMNAVRDLAMEQLKREDDFMKKWIALI
jgi:hypothetical protein